jgi:hypothetical protein
MKTIRHTVNVPAQMQQLLKERIEDYRSLSSYFVSLGFTDALYLPKRPIAKAFANASWQQQQRAMFMPPCITERKILSSQGFSILLRVLRKIANVSASLS